MIKFIKILNKSMDICPRHKLSERPIENLQEEVDFTY